jgi:cyclopropane-fatty-acyl-phospholipid synthase
MHRVLLAISADDRQSRGWRSISQALKLFIKRVPLLPASGNDEHNGSKSMSDTSVSRIPLLPQARSLRSSSDLARHFLLRVLSRIRVGSLTIHDGEDTHHFGGAAVDGEPQAEIVVHNREAFGKVLTGGTIASGEAYIDGDWSSPDLTEVTRLFSANMAAMESMQASQHWYTRLALRIAHAA